MDRLEELFGRQLSLQKLIVRNFNDMTLERALTTGNIQAKEELTKDLLLHLSDEIHEILRETNFRRHNTKNKKINLLKIHEEIVDAAHFLIVISLIWGLDVNSFYREFIRKNNKNIKKFSR